MAVTNTDNDSVAATGQASGFHPLLNDDLSPPATYTQATVQPPQGVFVSQYHLNNQTTWCFADYPQPENFYTMMDWREFKSMAIDPGDTAFRAVSCQYNSTSSMDNKLA